jgi:hypothetical protein
MTCIQIRPAGQTKPAGRRLYTGEAWHEITHLSSHRTSHDSQHAARRLWIREWFRSGYGCRRRVASQLDPLGAGKATPAEARSFAKQHTPQRPNSRSAQKAAAVQLPGDDDLTPLTLPETRLRLAAAGADNCRELLGVLGDYGTYVNSGLSKTVNAQVNN